MDEKKADIVKEALEIYMKYGIKSVTMDEMARQLGVSKKTLYVHVKDKNDLVEQCLMYGQMCDMEEIDKIAETNDNAIEELLEVGRYIIKTLGSIHPSIFFDLSKYHHSSLKSMQKHKNETVRGSIVNNLTRGIEQGVYRKNLSPNIISRLHIAMMDLIISTEVFPHDEVSVEQAYLEFFRYHIRGIASEKGLESLKELIRNDENL